MLRPETMCNCGHNLDLHTHYSRSIHCSKCPCNRFKRLRWTFLREVLFYLQRW